MMLVGQMTIGAIALAYIVREVRLVGEDTKYVAQLAERVLNKLDA